MKTNLTITRDNIELLNNLPPNLVTLDCSNLGLTELPQLPRNLTRLDCKGNPLIHINLDNVQNSIRLNIDCENLDKQSLSNLQTHKRRILNYFRDLNDNIQRRFYEIEQEEYEDVLYTAINRPYNLKHQPISAPIASSVLSNFTKGRGKKRTIKKKTKRKRTIKKKTMRKY
jgi:Leucine-rich repeat (LRR) protein